MADDLSAGLVPLGERRGPKFAFDVVLGSNSVINYGCYANRQRYDTLSSIWSVCLHGLIPFLSLLLPLSSLFLPYSPPISLPLPSLSFISPPSSPPSPLLPLLPSLSSPPPSPPLSLLPSFSFSPLPLFLSSSQNPIAKVLLPK